MTPRSETDSTDSVSSSMTLSSYTSQPFASSLPNSIRQSLRCAHGLTTRSLTNHRTVKPRDLPPILRHLLATLIVSHPKISIRSAERRVGEEHIAHHRISIY